MKPFHFINRTARRITFMLKEISAKSLKHCLYGTNILSLNVEYDERKKYRAIFHIFQKTLRKEFQDNDVHFSHYSFPIYY